MGNHSIQFYNISAEATLDVIGGKWKLLILCYLNCGPMRSSQFRKVIPNLSQKMLTQQLRELEEAESLTEQFIMRCRRKLFTKSVN